METEKIQERKKDWILFVDEKGSPQPAFVFLEHVDASVVKFKLHEDDDTVILIPMVRIIKVKDRRVVG